MKIHVAKFLKFWDYTIADFIPCWYPCCGVKANEICHIDPKQKGGRASAEYEENYIPLCRTHHSLSEGNNEQKKILWDVLIKKILQRFPNHKWSDYFKLTWYYKNHIESK